MKHDWIAVIDETKAAIGVLRRQSLSSPFKRAARTPHDWAFSAISQGIGPRDGSATIIYPYKGKLYQIIFTTTRHDHGVLLTFNVFDENGVIVHDGRYQE